MDSYKSTGIGMPVPPRPEPSECAKRLALQMLSKMDRPAWAALVRWAAPKLAKESPHMLIEIVCLEAQRRKGDGESMAATVAEILDECGLQLVPCA